MARTISEQKILEAYAPGLEVFYVWLQSLHNQYQAESKISVDRNGDDVKHCSFVIICPSTLSFDFLIQLINSIIDVTYSTFRV